MVKLEESQETREVTMVQGNRTYSREGGRMKRMIVLPPVTSLARGAMNPKYTDQWETRKRNSNTSDILVFTSSLQK